MKIYIKNLVLIFVFLQAIFLTQAIERKIQRSYSIGAIEKHPELKDMILKRDNGHRTASRPFSAREKQLLLEASKQRTLISWVAFGVNIALVMMFAWFAVVVNKQKSNNSFQG